MIISANVYGEFTVNVDRTQVLKALDIITINDLGVGESGYIRFWGGLCKFPAGTIGIDKYRELESDRSEYGTYLKITRLPKGKVAIEIPA